MNKRILPGIGLILIGAVLLFFGSARTVRVVVDGESRLITTRASKVADVLRDAGVEVSSSVSEIRDTVREQDEKPRAVSESQCEGLTPGSGLR